MAATDLSFSKNEENKYVASFVSEGPVTIQVKRKEAGALNIYANILNSREWKNEDSSIS